jgi:hypothetical protein
MRTFLVDVNNNFVIAPTGQIPIIGALPAISQTARQYGQALRGEMTFKLDEGVPYAMTAWEGNPNEAAFEVAQRARLLQVEGVLAVLAFEIVRAGDILKYTATLDTTEGQVSVNG